MPVIGFLSTTTAGPFAHLIAGFRRGLQEVGYFDGRNIVIEYRWAEGRYDRVQALALDLVQFGGCGQGCDSHDPHRVYTGTDPVRIGLVASLARPGGNATGVNIFTTELAEKRLGLLLDVVPAAVTIAILLNPNFAPDLANGREAEVAARALGKEIVVFNAASESEIDTAFAGVTHLGSHVLLVGSDPYFNSRREQIVALAARHDIPAIYEWREFAQAGGMMSYGTNLVEAYRQQGMYVGRILKGEKPADLPVIHLSKFELVLNLKTAKSLGIVFPPGLLAIADEVIE